MGSAFILTRAGARDRTEMGRGSQPAKLSSLAPPPELLLPLAQIFDLQPSHFPPSQARNEPLSPSADTDISQTLTTSRPFEGIDEQLSASFYYSRASNVFLEPATRTRRAG